MAVSSGSGARGVSSSSPAVVTVFEASDYESLMEIGFAWGDVFDIVTAPATTAEEGLRLGPQILQRRAV